MVRGGVPIGRAFGIPLRLHYSWFIIFALVTWALAVQYFPSAYPRWDQTTRIAAGIITSLLFFGSVLFHELMHSVVAQSEGLTIHSITLFALGGVSQMTEEPKTARDEFWMAIAGPGSSLVLAGIFWAIYVLLRTPVPGTNQFVAGISQWLGLVNLILGVFNLIPGFPLDGGRVFRSLIWWRNNNLEASTRIASNVGRFFGYAFIFFGIYLLFTGNWFNGIWLALIGWFLSSAAVGSYRQLMLQDMLKGHTAGEIMVQDCAVVPPDITVEQLVNEKILATGRRCFPVASGSRIEGLVTLDSVKSIPRDRWAREQLRTAMTPLEKLKAVHRTDDLNAVLQIMTQFDINQVPVVEDGNIVGMVGRDNLLNFINLRAELRNPG